MAAVEFDPQPLQVYAGLEKAHNDAGRMLGHLEPEVSAGLT
jgi:hypothetical protein